jgi:hypothetical protein
MIAEMFYLLFQMQFGAKKRKINTEIPPSGELPIKFTTFLAVKLSKIAIPHYQRAACKFQELM